MRRMGKEKGASKEAPQRKPGKTEKLGNGTKLL
jgi:hypothetical protein